MSPIHRGSTPAIGCYRGTVAISAVYQGTALVWQKAAATTTIPVYPTVRSSTAKSYSSSGETRTIPKPAGTQAGDLLVLYGVMDYSAVTGMNPPSGFTTTSIAGVTSERAASGTDNVRHGVYYKVAGSSEPSSYTWAAFTSGADGAGAMVCVKDWDGNTANLSFAMAETTKTAQAIPSVTPKKAGLALYSAAHDTNSTGTWAYDWVAPTGSNLAAVANNATAWSGQAVAAQILTTSTAISGKAWTPSRLTSAATPVLASVLTIGAGSTTATQLLGTYSGGSGGATTDELDIRFDDSTDLRSTYHLYAANLDWTKDVGILVYTDGSGEYGLANPTLNYLLAGDRGLVAVAKKHNMILLTPRAPGDGCNDGDGVCWYDNSLDGTTPAQKLEWSRQLMAYIYGRYNICKSRVVIGGYSSGAQWTTQYFGPAYAHEYMTDGVLLPISYGGDPKVTNNNTAEFKANVPVVWDVGETDDSWVQPTWTGSIQRGLDYYNANGYTTAITIVGGRGHNRYTVNPEIGEYGSIVDRVITQYVRPA